MSSKVNDRTVINEINSLKELVPFGIKNKKEFIILNNISIDINGRLFYENNNNEVKSVSSLIKEIKELQTSRWLNHLYFINGYGECIQFKKFVSTKHNLNFT